MNKGLGFNSAQLAQLARKTLEDLEPGNFRTVRRGYEPSLVEARLLDATQQIRQLLAALEEQSQRLAELEATPPAELEVKRMTAALGEEAVRVLDAARAAAAAKVERAEIEGAEILEEAHAAAAGIVQEGRANGRRAVAEARNLRERILGDLARRRQAHRVEVEQMRTLRDRMMESLVGVQGGVDRLLEGLVKAAPQALAAAERAGFRVASEPEATADEIEAELEAARHAGHALAPVASKPAARMAPAVPPRAREADDAADDSAPSRELGHGAGPPGSAAAAPGSPGLDAPTGGAGPQTGPPPSDDAGDGVYDMEAETDEDLDGLPSLAGQFAGVQPAGPGAPPEPAVRPKPGDAEAEAGADEAAASETTAPRTDAAEPAAAEPGDQEAEAAAEEAGDEAVGPDAGLAASAAPRPAADATDIFARLRSVSDEFSAEPAEAKPPDPGQPAEAAPPDPDPPAADPPATPAATREQAQARDDGASDAGHDAVAAAAEEMAAARAAAVAAITRNLKRQIMDEQSALLDAMRRRGRRAVASQADAGDRPYAAAALPPLQQFVSDMDFSIDDLDLAGAAAAIVSTLAEPVRARLAELAEGAASTEELGNRVRAVYRESRARRAPAAAEAALSAALSGPGETS